MLCLNNYFIATNNNKQSKITENISICTRDLALFDGVQLWNTIFLFQNASVRTGSGTVSVLRPAGRIAHLAGLFRPAADHITYWQQLCIEGQSVQGIPSPPPRVCLDFHGLWLSRLSRSVVDRYRKSKHFNKIWSCCHVHCLYIKFIFSVCYLKLLEYQLQNDNLFVLM